jgi:hypothetical protein
MECDFLPDQSVESLSAQWQHEASAEGKKHVLAILPGKLPRRLAEALLIQAAIPADRRVAELSRGERAALLAVVKATRFPVTGTIGFSKAEVTAGGVMLKEVDSRTMQSKLIPQLYLAGEILDLDGPIGGYNFQAAFSTGWLAGTAAARQ